MTNTGQVDFHHPYTPYDVQLQFMRAVYETLENGNGQVGIFESPTGTGKSLSLICAALTWLRHFKATTFQSSLEDVAEQFKDEPGWIVDQMLQRRRDELSRKWEEREERLSKIRAKEKRMEERAAKRRKMEGSSSRPSKRDIDEEQEFLVDYSGNPDAENDQDPLSSFSKETRLLMEKVGLASSKSQPEEHDEPEDEIKIFYTSRTHSQLSQFIEELRKPGFPSSFPKEKPPDDTNGGGNEGVKHVPLSSRQKLCINPDVSRLGSVQAINDRCTELQQPKSKNRCPYMPTPANLAQTHQLRDTALATIPDIEDMYELGKSQQVCPYYASRTAIPGSEIITLPYPLLLQKSARDALGIKLEGNIVIIDEAHNIMDAVANVHAADVRLGELRRARGLLGVYVKRFGKKLKGENRVMVGQLGRVIEALAEWMDNTLRSKGPDQGIVDTMVLLKYKSADQINLFDLIKYLHESKLAFKIESYSAHLEEQDAAHQQKSHSPVLHRIGSFLLALTNLSSEGRIFYEKSSPPSPSSPEITLSYLLLSPTHAFSTIASSARAIILAGGTMSPFEDYKAHLFPNHLDTKIRTLSCGHVIPSSNLCVWTLASSRPGPVSPADTFEFSFQKRSDRNMIRQLGNSILNICSVVPDGVVVFFPSYGYLDEVVSVWQATSSQDKTGPIWDRLQAKKAVMKEAKGGSSDNVLQEYTEAILGGGDSNSKSYGNTATQRGAMLLSVVGGKMSEGINFSDRLGRCVVIVGLPYPNINSPEWKARIEYIESSALSRLTSTTLDPLTQTKPSISRDAALATAKQEARDFYENSCMRAVNQSIGRAIRHRGDYAAIVLVDKRFGTERIRGKLPNWIRGGMVDRSEEKGPQGLMGALNMFFRTKKTAS